MREEKVQRVITRTIMGRYQNILTDISTKKKIQQFLRVVSALYGAYARKQNNWSIYSLGIASPVTFKI